MSNLAIIPARGGSKRIPGKNTKSFFGKPIIHYPIHAALDSELFDRVIVSTDSAEISDAAKAAGAEVPFYRSAANSDDQSPLVDGILEVMSLLAEKGERYDNLCCIFATAPFVTARIIREGYEKLGQGTCDAVFTVKQHSSPIWRSFKQNAEGHLEMNWKDHTYTRSQDLPVTYYDAGQIYWVKAASMISQRTFYTKNAEGLILGQLDAHDIDTPEDWLIAERLYKFNLQS